MGRPAPEWFASLAELDPDQHYTASRIAKKVARTAADIRLVLSRRISPRYQLIHNDVLATWSGEELIRLSEKYLVEKKARKQKKKKKT